MANIDSVTNPDLAEERRNLLFNASALTNLLHGGEKRVARRREIGDFVDSCQAYKDPVDTAFMTRQERMENAARKAAALVNEKTTFPTEDFEEMIYFRYLALAGDISPFELHYLAALPYIQGQADEEQSDKWLPLLLHNAINVTYAQTELGHGTNLRELETTATYDPAKQEFIINSPSLTSIKWWPGNLGKSSNYAVVIAQLVTRGRRHGIHAFIVPIRHPESHMPLPGVHVGEIGPKFGMPAGDNGFVRFTNVRVPRENMLMRHAKVLVDGTYVPPVHQKLSYGGMVFIRAMMISWMNYSLQRACTIAIRYSCVRRQGYSDQFNNEQEVEKGNNRRLENKLIEYQTQQYRLFPELAKAYALHFVAGHMRSLYMKTSRELYKGDVSNLARLHALSAGLKAVATRDAALGIEICRLSCGGHGYSLASGLPELYADTVAGCTYEGDNIVLLLQTARALVKDDSLGSISAAGPTNIPTEGPLSLPEMVQAYRTVATGMIRNISQHLRDVTASGHTAQRAWDSSTVELCRTAKANVRAYIVETFANVVDNQSLDPSVRHMLTLLCELYAVCGIQARSGDFMEHAKISKSQIHATRSRCYELLAALRPTAVQLVDAFEFRDRELRSVLGRYDGNVYEKLYEWAQNSPLNRSQVLDTFPKYLGPIMRNGRSKL